MGTNKYKKAMLMSVIGLALSFVINIVLLILTFNVSLFDKAFDSLINDYGYGDYFAMFGMSADASTEALFWGSSIATSVIGLIFIAVAALFVYFNRKDGNLSIEDFQKRKGMHIGMIVFLFISAESTNSIILYGVSEAVYYLIYLLSLAAEILLFISFVMMIVCVVQNTRQVRFYNSGMQNQAGSFPNGNYTYTYSSSNNSFEEKKNEEAPLDAEATPSKEEEKEEPVTPKKVTSQASLDELYDLLSKLDKEHKAGTISDEDYERMKNTILDNYKNS